MLAEVTIGSPRAYAWRHKRLGNCEPRSIAGYVRSFFAARAVRPPTRARSERSERRPRGGSSQPRSARVITFGSLKNEGCASSSQSAAAVDA